MMRDTEKTCPFITDELIEYIEECFPMKDFDVSTTKEQLLSHVGQRTVVNFLKHQHVMQNESVITNQ